jgi:thiol:disulfide interchange protein DsbD
MKPPMDASAAHPTHLFALGGGLVTALTPCVYPMIPITVAIFGVKAGTPRARAIALAAAYVAGIAIMFGALGTLFALSGKAFGTFLGNPWVIVPLAAFFVAMALSMFGAFELKLPEGLQARLSRVGGAGFGGAFLMGLVGGIIAAPCTGPPLASLLLYVSTTRDVLGGFTMLATFGAGIGAPFFLVAGFSMSLPKPGAWMEWGKSFFGILFLLAALYYLENISPLLSRFRSPDPRFAFGMLGMVAAGLLLGAIHASFHGGWLERVRKGAGVGLIALALFGLNNYRLTPKGDIKLTWLTDEATAMAQAKSSGRPLLIDFGADWCKPCKELEVKIFARRDIAELMLQYTLLKIDATNEDDDPRISEIRRRYKSDTLPSIRIVSLDGDIVARSADGDLPDPREFRDLLFKKRF